MGGLTAMHSRVGLCPGDHRDEFFMPDPGPNEKCPSCDEVLIQFVAASDLDKAREKIAVAKREAELAGGEAAKESYKEWLNTPEGQAWLAKVNGWENRATDAEARLRETEQWGNRHVMRVTDLEAELDKALAALERIKARRDVSGPNKDARAYAIADAALDGLREPQSG